MVVLLATDPHLHYILFGVYIQYITDWPCSETWWTFEGRIRGKPTRGRRRNQMLHVW